jgi:RNA polymerase-associated protein
MSAQNKRSTMTLYTSSSDPFCHRIKIVLAEKGISADIIDIDHDDKLEELHELNPYGSVPTLMAKDLVVYEPDIIFEYLGERFPYPPLLSVFPLDRAIARMLSKKIDSEWIPLLINALGAKDDEIRYLYKIKLLKLLLSLIPTLKRQPYLLGEDFTIVDCSMAVILYNLPKLCIKLPEKAMPLIRYATRLFNRPSFRKSINM